MNKRVKKKNVPHDNPRVKSQKPTEPLGVTFSYKFLIDDNKRFSIKNRDARYLEALFQRLRDLSSMKVNEIRGNKSLRCHPIDWNDKNTTESCFGLPNEDQIVDIPYQFKVSDNEHGRVHGFFIDNVFYIVWLDPEHNLYA